MCSGKFIISLLLFFWKLFKHDIFIIWEFHTMHLYPILPSSAPYPVACPTKKIRKKNEFNLCCLHSHWSMDKLLMARPLKKWAPPPFPASSYLSWRATFQHPYHFFSQHNIFYWFFGDFTSYSPITFTSQFFPVHSLCTFDLLPLFLKILICVICILSGSWSNSQCPIHCIELSPSPLTPLLEAIYYEEWYFTASYHSL